METIPPSYEEATTQDYWKIIAQYIKSSDLCAASLVSRRWHQIFAPYLWGNPASHFGTENDRVYVALTRFKRVLPRVRLTVRELTHTLHLPPAQSELYDGPHAEWLRDVLEQLPNLQSLIVSQLPFFDHSALLVLRQYSTPSEPSKEDDFPIYPLRLLIAAQCGNTTANSLAEALSHWPSLVFLDLSDTVAARDHAVLSCLHYMMGLQVLKLRHVGLRDEDIEVLAEAIGVRVRSLDLRNNKITDASVRKLINTCFRPYSELHANDSIYSGPPVEDWPSGVRRPSPILLDEFRGDDLDERFVRRLTKGVVSRLPSEDLPAPGLTHLYLDQNFVSVEGVSGLLRTRNLNVLDVGLCDTARALGRPQARSSVSHPVDYSAMLPGPEKLTPLLEQYAQQNLTYLRIHHAVVTKPTPAKSGHSPPELQADEIGGAQELHAEEVPRYELNGEAPAFEMGDSSTPRYELAGDPMQFWISPPVGARPTSNPEEEAAISVHRGAAFAPEPVVVDEGPPPVLTATGFGTSAPPINGDAHDLSEDVRMANELEIFGVPKWGSTQGNDHKIIAIIIGRRHELRFNIESTLRGLLPGALPALRTLVLTNVPSTNSDLTAVNALKKFIQDCAVEYKYADIQASLEYKSLYIPGKPRSMQRQYRAREIFALQRIVLEMAPTKQDTLPDSPRTPVSPASSIKAFTYRNRSATEDPDTEAFWRESENDFSFFGDDEECGLPGREPAMRFPMSVLSEKMTLPMDALNSDGLPQLQQVTSNPSIIGGSAGGGGDVVPAKERVDVVAELAKFRRERKAAYGQAVSRGEKYIMGYWPGEVKVVRHHARAAMGKGSDKDYYGNYFEKGLYR
ncbi:MAG: hypothetical protein MMC33_006211 [Icmadophila ericetorum]|nr:hypothetical protein [Icmadophila ericetorum]